jgi:peptidoglycan hydrolase-like protein with peptidoglycan-binding domain
MNKKIIKLTESDLVNIVKKVLNEQLVNVIDTSEEIKSVQQRLVNLGYNLGTTGPKKDGVDGDMGRLTQTAIKDFQTKNKIKPTGVLDQTTQNALSLTPNNRPNLSSIYTNGFKSGTINSINDKLGQKINVKNSEKKSKNTKNLKNKTDKGFFIDCVKNSPKKQTKRSTNGDLVILIDGHYFYGNGRVKKPNNEMASYFCYDNGVRIKNDKGEKTYLDTGVKTSHEETSRFSGGLSGFLRKSFPNVAQIFSTKPLTGKDFTESQKKVVFNVIQNAIIKRGQNRKQGCTEYIDYSPDIDQKLNKDGGATTAEMLLGSGFSDEFRVATLLGRFCYSLQPNGSYLVNDDYDFHKWSSFTVKPEEVKGMTYPQKIGYIMDKTGLSPYGAIRHIGYLEHPDNAPAATKTKITLNIDPGYFAKQDKSLKTDLNKLTNQDDTAIA